MLKFENVSFSYSKNGKKILSNVSFELANQKITTIIGKNGCGKTTLLSCANQNLKYEGKILINDKDLKEIKATERAKIIATLPQILPVVNITVRDLVSMGRSPYVGIGKKLNIEDKNIINKAMEDMGIIGMAEESVLSLSGGERQNAFVAMILAQNTQLIIFDEPTTYMDVERKKHFNKIIKDLRDKHNKTVLLVTHDIIDAMRYSDRLLVMHDGKIIFDGNPEDCAKGECIEKAFGVQKKIFKNNEETYAVYE